MSESSKDSLSIIDRFACKIDTFVKKFTQLTSIIRFISSKKPSPRRDGWNG